MCARRIIVITLGGIVLAAGLAMLILPGPGLIVAFAGVGILATELPWARKWLEKLWDKIPISEEKKRKAEEKLPVH